MYSNVHVDATDFEVCRFTKNVKLYISQERKKISSYKFRAITWQKMVY